jgi:uncharacterized protein YfaS (alpha-2-macroglobulin family)
LGRIVSWFLSIQTKSGFIGPYSHTDSIYGPVIATYALCEALHGTMDEALLAKVQKAIDVIESARTPMGGWRYEVPTAGNTDMSVTSWALTALFAARRVGLEVNVDGIKEALLWTEKNTVGGRTGV